MFSEHLIQNFYVDNEGQGQITLFKFTMLLRRGLVLIHEHLCNTFRLCRKREIFVA